MPPPPPTHLVGYPRNNGHVSINGIHFSICLPYVYCAKWEASSCSYPPSLPKKNKNKKSRTREASCENDDESIHSCPTANTKRPATLAVNIHLPTPLPSGFDPSRFRSDLFPVPSWYCPGLVPTASRLCSSDVSIPNRSCSVRPGSVLASARFCPGSAPISSRVRPYTSRFRSSWVNPG